MRLKWVSNRYRDSEGTETEGAVIIEQLSKDFLWTDSRFNKNQGFNFPDLLPLEKTQNVRKNLRESFVRLSPDSPVELDSK